MKGGKGKGEKAKGRKGKGGRVKGSGVLGVGFWGLGSGGWGGPQHPTPNTQHPTPPLAVLLALALCALNLWGLNKDIVGFFHDDSIYTVVAKSLSEGKGYHIISLPSSPAETKYPFVYPYLLSWIWSLNPSFPENIFLLKAVNVGFLFAALLFSYAFYCQNIGERRIDALLYVFLVGGNPFVFSLTDYPLSDTLFFTLTLLALLLCSQRGHSPPTPARVALLSGVVALAYLTRQAGVALILAGILYFLTARWRRELFLYLFIVAVLISPWLLWQFSHAADTPQNPLLLFYVSYEKPAFLLLWSDPVQMVRALWGKTCHLIASFDLGFLLPLFPGLRFLVYPLLIWGGYLSLRRHTVFFYSFLLLYLLLVLGWPFLSYRYILPLLPIALLFLFRGVQAAESYMAARTVSLRTKRSTEHGERSQEGGGQLVPWLARLPLAALLVLNLVWLSFYLQGPNTETTRAWYGRRLPYGWDGFTETFAWIREHTAEEDVLMTTYDPMYYLYTGRKAVRPGLYKPELVFYPDRKPAANPGLVQEIREGLAALGVRYLIIDPMEEAGDKEAPEKLLDQLLRSYPVRPKLVFNSADGLHKVYALPLSGERSKGQGDG